MKTYRLSAEARLDYFAAYDYIAEHNLSAAVKWETRMLEAFDHLAEWPGTGRVRTEYAPEYLRFWVAGDYIVLYDPSAEPLSIVAILHGSQDLSGILARRIEFEADK